MVLDKIHGPLLHNHQDLIDKFDEFEILTNLNDEVLAIVEEDNELNYLVEENNAMNYIIEEII